MSSRYARILRWVMLLGTGSFVLQTTSSCDQTLQVLQTGLLGGIAAGMYYLAVNV